MAKIMWLPKSRVAFTNHSFDLLKEVYTLKAPPSFGYTTPIFDYWGLQDDVQKWEIVPSTSDAESECEGSTLTGSTITPAQSRELSQRHKSEVPLYNFQGRVSWKYRGIEHNS
jgi:hypothetical protein